VLCFIVIAGRLFQLQVLEYDTYHSYAKQRVQDKVIQAKRGRILLHESEPGKYFELVSNVSLDLLFADPLLIENPDEVAEKIAPLLFEAAKNQHKACGGNERCLRTKLETQLIGKSMQDGEESEEELLSEEELKRIFTAKIREKIAKKERDFVLLKTGLLKEILMEIQDLRLPGVYTKEDYVYANPLEISDPRGSAEKLLPYLSEYGIENLEFALTRRPNRYVRIQNKIDFETAEAIKSLEITGIGFVKEHWRNYAEQDGSNYFASQVLGFIDHENKPVYGLEKSMDEQIRGKTGVIRADVDISGRTLTSRSSTIIEEAINGSDIVLTIDHVVQNKVEELLRRQVIESSAASGEAIVQEPKTGRIIAMATYPGFNPNKYGEVYEKEEIFLSQEDLEKNVYEQKTKEGSRYFLYFNPGYRIEIFKNNEKWYAYSNKVGIRAYRNPIVSDYYEPGSVFKAIAMAAAIDAKEVTPTTIYHDTGPLIVDDGDFTIHNSTDRYYGSVTMREVLALSVNTGMAFVAKKLGPATLHEYLSNFGFGERTNVELPDEEKGVLTYHRRWLSESDLITKAFGQGVASTPLQMVNALSAIANGGTLMQPYIVDAIVTSEGKVIETQPQIIRKVISETSSKIMTAMLVHSVEMGVASPAAIDNHFLAGKTGTSQIATGGVYEKGDGSTIASFGGYGPINDPQFTILVKVNRPRVSPWGAANAAPLFQKIADFLFDYYHIPPDKTAYVP
jgi:cell division protein FtsI/penicillin-binding protein 2